jgi:hypothetical protein
MIVDTSDPLYEKWLETEGNPELGRIDNLIGETFGRLKVIDFIGRRSDAPAKWWLCKCSCGAVKPVRNTSLKHGKNTWAKHRDKPTLSCGCLSRELTETRFRKHGLLAPKNLASKYLYDLWHNLTGRCDDPQHSKYKYYGGRGISYDPRWGSLETFYQDILSEIGHRPTSKHSLDRIDNESNYYPGNIRWATQTQQIANRRIKTVTNNNH